MNNARFAPKLFQRVIAERLNTMKIVRPPT